MARRRVVETQEAGPGPPRRPPPWSFENQWAVAGLVLLLLVAGLLIWLFALRDDGDESTTTETVTTQTVTTTTGTTAPAAVTVPDLTGRPFAEATEAAAADGLAADSYPVESAEARGTVVAQEPDPGTAAQEGDVVRLNVSRGGAGGEATTTVPDVTGPEAPEARSALVDAGLTVRTVDRAAPEPDNVNEVILQEPDAGASVPELTQVTIYVGR